MSDQTGDLLQQTKAGDFRALARLLTVLEREGPEVLGRFPEILEAKKPAFRVGITGPPGAGKSTLINRLIGELRKQGLKVGVLAVDPSSPFSKGAVLGDRIRYNEHSTDPGVYIRSLGTRGSLGGLSASAFLMVRALDLAGFDLVLLETVGVGQTELEIMNVADWVAVVLVPESGDSIQGMKAGLLEIADAFIVNKGDRPGADIFARELEAALHLSPHVTHQTVSEFPPVIKTVATTGEGLQLLLSCIHTKRSSPDWSAKRNVPERLQAEAKALLRAEAERAIEEKTEKITTAKGIASLFTRGTKP